MEVPKPIRELIVSLRNQGKTLREIGRIVDKRPGTVCKIIKRYEEIGCASSRPRSGRPPKLNSVHEREICKAVHGNPSTSAQVIANNLSRDYNVKVTPQTVRNRLKSCGFVGRVPRKKPYIGKLNRKRRLDFAKEYISKPTPFWESVIFSDESKFNVSGSDGRQKVWRKKNKALESKNLRPTFKHGGGGIMVWGCMAANGVGSLQIINGIMNQYVYIDILKNNLQQSANKLGLGRSFIFQQDNDPKHTAMKTKEWLLYNAPRQLKTPPQSPDLNPIEHLWDEIGRRVRKRGVKNKEELKQALLDEWDKIPAEVTHKLVGSMKKRLLEVIRNKGGPTSF